MSRRKQSNPKSVKVEEYAMQGTSGSSIDLKNQQNTSSDGYSSTPENSDFDEDADRLVIDTGVLSSSSSSLRHPDGVTTGSRGRRVSDSQIAFSIAVSMMADCDIQTTSSDCHDTVFEEAITEVTTGDMPINSRPNSILSSSSERDNVSLSDSISNGGDVSLNLSGMSLPDVTLQDSSLLSDGGVGSFKNSLSKSRKKSDRILPKPGNNGEENFICPICQEVLPSNHDFTCHIRSHNSPTSTSSINTCTICEKVLSSQSSLDRHMLVHSGERPFRCRVCAMAFTTNGNMHRHMRIHEKNFQAVSGVVLPNGMLAKSRRKKKHLADPGNVTSQHLAEQIERQLDLHLSVTNKNGSPAPEKKRKLGNHREDVKPHAKKILLDVNMTKRILLTSNLATERKNNASLHSSLRKTLAFSAKRIATINLASNPTICSECGCKFYSRLCLVADLEEHERRQGTSLAICCTACQVVLSSVNQFKDHLSLAHATKSESVAAAEEKVAETKKSWKNGAPNITLNELMQLDFTCRQFSLAAKLFAEKIPRRQAPKDMPNYCSACEHLFLCENSFALHMSEHASDCSSTCNTCGLAFLTSVQHQNHVLLHERDVIMSGYVNQASSEVNLVQEKISQNEYMLMLGMKSTSSSSAQMNKEVKDVTESETSDKNLNNLRLDANQNFVNIPSVGKKPKTIAVENPLLASILPSSSLVSILPKLSGKRMNHTTCNTQRSNKEPMQARALLKLSPDSLEKSSGTLCDPLLDMNIAILTCLNGSSLPGALDIDIVDISKSSVSTGDRILPQIQEPMDIAHQMDSVKQDSSSGQSACSTKGATPFRCSECSYSSTDKSTLLRHERKHNGQRPFQCRICDFAFTTKANCERHVRKKHSMEQGQRVEDAIGYNRFAVESGTEMSPGLTSETVCKFCGEDFKFYRALKHHLRSQTSCQYKPCQCKICSLRFSTKANCLRHLQKKHHDEMVGPVETYMLVNTDIRSEESVICNGLALLASEAENCSRQLLPEIKNEILVAQARDVVGGLGRQQRTHESPFPGYVDDADDSDEPLDFSLKSQKTSAFTENYYTIQPEISVPWQSDEPIDLTVRGQGQRRYVSPRETENPGLGQKRASSAFGLALLATSTSALSSTGSEGVLKAEKVLPHIGLPVKTSDPQKGLSFELRSVDGHFSCTKCHLLFKHEHELSTHFHSPSIDEASLFHCRLCPSSFNVKAQLDFHLKKRHPQFTDAASAAAAAATNSYSSRNSKLSLSLLKEPNNNSTESVNANLFNKPAEASFLPDSGDLASVPRILESTSGKQLTPLLAMGKSTTITSVNGLHGQPDLEIFTQTVDQSCTGRSNSQNSRKSDQVGIKKEVDLPINRSRKQSHDAEEQEKGAEESGIMKKKRNSYADSPHKLLCSFCSRAFPWISSLKRHILTHTGQKPYRCKQCPVTFSTKSNRERHMIRKHGLDVHDPATRQTMDRPFKCHLCVFSSFTTSGKLLRHYSLKHSDKEIPENLLNCTGSMSQDESDLASRSGSAVTGLELLTAEQLAEMQDNEDEEDDESGQDMTDDELKEVEHLTNTLMQGMNRTNVTVPHSLGASIEVCVAQLLTQTPMSKAVANITSDSLSDKHVNPERDNYNVDKITECWKCKKTFDCRKTLLRHLKEHSIDLPFKCYLCDASFEDRLTSLMHKQKEHPSDWATVQEKNKVSNLKEYTEFMEGVVKDTLEGKVTRRTHEGVELDIKPESDYAQRKVFCTLCPKRFWSLQDLRRHMRSHTGDRPFECDICFTRFTLKHSMMRHRRKHTNEGAGTGGETQCSASDDDNSMNASAITCDGNGVTQSKPSVDFSEECQSTRVGLLTTNAEPSTSAANEKVYKSSLSQVFNISSVALSKVSDQSDLLQSLLGIDDRSTIDKMLESPTKAATMLGIQRAKDESAT